MTYVYFALAMVGIAFLASRSGGIMGFFLARLGSDGSWDGMANVLGLGTLVRSVPYALVGHAGAFGSRSADTEIAALGVVYRLGIIHATVLYSILLYPLWRWFKARRWCATAVPAVAAVTCGFLSLAHYGSLFRITSVFLFYAFGAVVLCHVVNPRSPGVDLANEKLPRDARL
jgi:hypothetical protein